MRELASTGSISWQGNDHVRGRCRKNPDPLKAVADAMEAAVEAAKEGAADTRESAERVLPVAGMMLGKFAYNTCYAVSYRIVFSTVFLARSVPQDNAMVHGLVDGARAARDMVQKMKARHETCLVDLDLRPTARIGAKAEALRLLGRARSELEFLRPDELLDDLPAQLLGLQQCIHNVG